MKKLFGILALLFLPAVAFAQEDLAGVLGVIYGLLTTILPILILAAVIFFIYGLVVFIAKSGDEEGRKKGISIMIYGILGLFVIVSVWGLVAILQNTFIGDNLSPDVTESPDDFSGIAPDSPF